MAYKPILFSTPMVQAILDNRKTVTRRLDDRYQVGDILWVRETWCERLGNYKLGRYIYKAHDRELSDIEQYALNENKWRPSIHMPKAAARIFLRVTSVRKEPLQDITIAEMHEEGVTIMTCDRCISENGGCRPQLSEDVFCGMEDFVEAAFANIWDGTLKRKDIPTKGYVANPNVTVVTFERTAKPEGWPK